MFQVEQEKGRGELPYERGREARHLHKECKFWYPFGYSGENTKIIYYF